jgi:small nuclear ribonucleoprotein (snRNP)-like protein
MPSDLKKSGRKSGGRRAARWFLEFVTTSVLIWVAFVLGGRALPQIAIGQLSDLTNTKIDVKSVEFRFDGSVFIKDLVVRPRNSADYDNSILKADTVRVHFRLGSLLTLRPRVKEIFVDDFTLRIQYDSNNGQWNLSAMKIQLPGGGVGRLPLVWLEHGTVEYSKVVNGRVVVIASSPVSAGFRPAKKIVGGCSFDISSASKQDLGKSAIFGNWQPGRVIVGGRISSKDVPGFERPWMVRTIDAELTYEPNKTCVLMAKIKGFTCPPSESRNLFAFDTKTVMDKAPFVNAIQMFFRQYNPSGTIDIDLQASGNPERLNEGKIEGKVTCKDVALCDSKFPYAVEHLTGQVELTEKSAKLNSVVGRHGAVELVLNGWAKDFGPDYKYNFQISSDNMLLDKDLYNAINREEQKFWSEFSPSGVVSTSYSRVRQSPTDERSVLAVQLLDVEGMYAGFGYPLKNTTGKLVVADNNMVLSDVVSQWGGRRITINGKVGFGLGVIPSYDIVVKGENIPLDATLEAALPTAQKEFYNQFETQGLVDATVKVVSAGRKDTASTFTAEVFPKKSSLKAKALPILVNEVEGRVVFRPGMIDIEQLEGRYKGGTVAFSGLVWSAGNQREPGYCLSMRAKKVELSEDLADALPGSLGAMVGQLRAGGEVNLAADVSRNADGNCGPNRLVIECLGNTIDCNLLPYALHDISGRIAITQSHIVLEDITARASHTIRGSPIESVMRMAGSVALSEANGTSEGMRITSGDVNISGENVRFKNKSLSKVDTVLRYDSESGQWLSRYFVADFYDGKMIGKLQFNKSDRGGLDYLLEASVAGADLKKFLSDTDKEVRPDEHYSSGSISGSVGIIGSFVDDNIRLGRCRLKIIDMQVGKRSPLANLLAVLNLTETSDYAFDQMTVDAYIQDNKMFLRQLDLSGKSVAFYGSGWLDLKTDDIKMTLTARGRRLAPASPSILQSLTEGLSRAVVRVEVKGKISDPQITTMPLPVIKETLEILGTPKGE